jgi:hypothetical protein
LSPIPALFSHVTSHAFGAGVKDKDSAGAAAPPPGSAGAAAPPPGSAGAAAPPPGSAGAAAPPGPGTLEGAQLLWSMEEWYKAESEARQLAECKKELAECKKQLAASKVRVQELEELRRHDEAARRHDAVGSVGQMEPCKPGRTAPGSTCDHSWQIPALPPTIPGQLSPLEISTQAPDPEDITSLCVLATGYSDRPGDDGDPSTTKEYAAALAELSKSNINAFSNTGFVACTMMEILAPGALNGVLGNLNSKAKNNVTVLMMGHCNATEMQVDVADGEKKNMCWDCMRGAIHASLGSAYVRCMGFLGCESAAPVVTLVEGRLYHASRLLLAMTRPWDGEDDLNVGAFVGYGKNTNNPERSGSWAVTCSMDLVLMLTMVTSSGTAEAALLPDILDRGSDYPFRMFEGVAALSGSPLLLFQAGAGKPQETPAQQNAQNKCNKRKRPRRS